MGMFDYYRPAGSFQCPVCQKPLGEWQGKDGASGLFVWKQGRAQPVGCDEECVPLTEGLEVEPLPPIFFIYSYDCDEHCVSAICRSLGGVWSETRLYKAETFPYPGVVVWYDESVPSTFGREWTAIFELRLRDRIAAMERIWQLQRGSPGKHKDAQLKSGEEESDAELGWDPPGTYRREVVKQVFDEQVAAGKIPRPTE